MPQICNEDFLFTYIQRLSLEKKVADLYIGHNGAPSFHSYIFSTKRDERVLNNANFVCPCDYIYMQLITISLYSDCFTLIISLTFIDKRKRTKKYRYDCR
jgi:hypothetical protein